MARFELVAHGPSLPHSLENRNGDTKHTLERAVESFLAPEITQHRKQGFQVPLPARLS
jgi:hypothetical protein